LHHIVSLAITLLHKPPLLILDEPTVGLDPVLRAKLWQHLRDLIDKEGVTILITTHYIEEARYRLVVSVLIAAMYHVHLSVNSLVLIEDLHLIN
jgi:ABC-type multidrug transport system ATPase subunit